MTDQRPIEPSLKMCLATILGFSERLVQKSVPDDPRRDDLEEIRKAAAAAMRIVVANGASVPAPERLRAVEREHIARVLAEVSGNKQVAARRLGISRRTLYRRLERHGLIEGHVSDRAATQP